MTLNGFHYMGRQFDIEMKGSGKYIAEISVDGIKYRGTNMLPADSFQKGTDRRVKVMVQRTKQKQSSFYIKSGYGIELSNYSSQKGVIKAEVSGLGTCNLKLHAETEPRVSVNDKKADIKYYPDVQLAVVKIVFDKNEKKSLEIRN